MMQPNLFEKNLTKSHWLIPNGIICTLILLFTACEYELKEEFFNKVSPVNELENVSAGLYDDTDDQIISADTFIIFRQHDFVYSISPRFTDVALSALILNDDTLDVVNGNRISFTLDPADYQRGYYKLKFISLVKSGSGSLADQVGIEVIPQTLEKIFAVDLDPPNQPKITDVSIVEDFMTFSWEKYERYNFQEYIIDRFCETPEGSGNFEYCSGKRIYNKDITQFVDSSYLQGKVYYRVRVKAAYLEAFSDKSAIQEVIPGNPFQFISDEQGKIAFTWSKPGLTGPFEKFILYNTDNAPWPILLESYNIESNEFSFQSDYRLGTTSKFRLLTQPLEIGALNPQTSEDLIVTPGVKIPSFGSQVVSNIHQKIYQTSEDQYSEEGKIYITDLNNFNRLDSISWSELGISNNTERHDLFTSLNGERVFFINSDIIIELSPETLERINTYDLSFFNINDKIIQFLPQVAANGFMLFPEGARINVFDLNNREIITINGLSSGSDIRGAISPNGKYIASDNMLFEYSSGEFNRVHRFGFAIRYERFVNDNEVLLFDFNNKKVFLYKIQEDELIQLNVSEYVNFNKRTAFDPFSNRLYYTSGYIHSATWLESMSLDDFSVTKVPVAKAFDYDNYSNYFLIGDKVIWNQGRYLKK